MRRRTCRIDFNVALVGQQTSQALANVTRTLRAATATNTAPNTATVGAAAICGAVCVAATRTLQLAVATAGCATARGFVPRGGVRSGARGELARSAKVYLPIRDNDKRR